ncbi:histamine H3 receptor-like [Ranitomeya variabilis]|uniref:histamine H3 receptor-like n=1 Tax=Ranitomeya variabilis TaxID=490064 RepID=UPI00405780AC
MTRLLVYNESGLVVLNLNETSGLDPRFSEGVRSVIMLYISLLMMVTIFGNILVMVAFIVDKSLRTQSNFFLLNLAICDFFIGAFNAPLYVLYLLTGKWMLGKDICKLWLITDYSMSTASAFNIVLISYDRFLCVTKALLYRSVQKRHGQTALKMASIWVVSFLLYGPAILFWEAIFGKKEMAESECTPAFSDTWSFFLGTSIFDFILPLISISHFNLSIYWSITKRSKKKRQQSAPPSSALRENHGKPPYIIATTLVLSTDRMKISVPLRKKVKKSLSQCFQTKDTLQMDNVSNTYNIHVLQLSRDKKVAKSLTILVCIFAMCWAPITFLISVRTACRGYCIPSYWYDITVWILYTNSAINPILYPLCHKRFRKAFSIIFRLKKQNS